MECKLLVIDDFYQDPDAVRAYALLQNFEVKGNFPGARTKPYLPEDVQNCIGHYMHFAGKITNWYNDDPNTSYSGAFQLTTALDRTWIHSDTFNMWAGVCYLTPNAPHTAGTGLFRHKATGIYSGSNNSKLEPSDYTKWDLFDVIGNKYNRLIIYRGDLFHASLNYFGHNYETGRLFQTFFFDTERY